MVASLSMLLVSTETPAWRTLLLKRTVISNNHQHMKATIFGLSCLLHLTTALWTGSSAVAPLANNPSDSSLAVTMTTQPEAGFNTVKDRDVILVFSIIDTEELAVSMSATQVSPQISQAHVAAFCNRRSCQRNDYFRRL